MEYNNNSQNDFNLYSSDVELDEMPVVEIKPKVEKMPEEKKQDGKKKFSFLTVIISIAVAAVIGATTGAGAVLLTGSYFNQESGGTTIVVTDDGTQKIVSEIKVDEEVNGVIEAVAEKVTPSVVGISTTASTNSFFGGGSEEVTGEGSGIVYTEDGYIITNYHVIEEAVTTSSTKINVYLSRKTDVAYPATVVGYNVAHDLAVIKITAKNLVPIELADPDSIKVGQYVAAVGNPGGLDFMGSVTYGIISGLNRVIGDSSTGADVRLIQTDAAINPGNSGGALVNTEGKLVGVNSSKIAATEYEGMGFAIPVDTVKEICDKIITNKDTPKPYVGITISDRYTAEQLKEMGYPVGAVVNSVTSGGPAQEAGIRRGDIITEFNGKAVKNYTELSDAISDTKPGDKVNVKVYRSGKYYTLKLTVGSNNAQ